MTELERRYRMDPDEQWAKSYVYSAKALRVLLCPSGRLAIFDHRGAWIGWGADFAFQQALVAARDAKNLSSIDSPRPSAPRSSTELDF